VHKVQTVRGTQFGRHVVGRRNLANKTIDGFVSFISEKGIQLLKKVKEQNDAHFFVSYNQLETGEPNVSNLVTFFIKDGDAFKPAIFVLCSNMLLETLEQLIDWLKVELKDYFLPKSVTTDMNWNLMKTCFEKLSDSKFFVSEYNFNLELWKMADDLEMVERLCPNSDLILLIKELVKLPFEDEEQAKKKFEELKLEHIEKPSYRKELVLEFLNKFQSRFLDELTFKF
jgi:hypothetical protein